MIQNLTIPVIYCPFPSAISPYANTVHQHTLNWVRQFNLVHDDNAWQHLETSKFGRLAARAYPHAPLDRLEMVSDWNTWLFILDDQCDELGMGKHPDRLAALHGRCLEILAGGAPLKQDTALVHALHDIRTRIAPLMPLSWFTRFVQNTAEYFESTEWEAENRQNNRWPNAETYIRMRPYTGGLLTDIDLIELTESIALPLAIRKHPCIRDLTRTTNNVVCWSNDIISLQKEHRHHDMHNLALIFNHHQAIGLQAAIDQVNDLISSEVRYFMNLANALPDFGNHNGDVAKFAGVMRAWMRGNLDWSLESGRYLPPVGDNLRRNAG